MTGETRKGTNKHDTREGWLRAATDGLRDHFERCGLPLPERIRFSIGFTSSGRKSKRVGELWHAATSADGTFELFIRADLDDPLQILGVLMHQLVHAVVPPEVGHGKAFRDAALKLGMDGKMREASPGPLLQARLAQLIESLGPLPHARLAIERDRDGLEDRRKKKREERRAAGEAKKQGTRLLKAECSDGDCGYTVRLAMKWVDKIGPPFCPRHGAMNVIAPNSPTHPD